MADVGLAEHAVESGTGEMKTHDFWVNCSLCSKLAYLGFTNSKPTKAYLQGQSKPYICLKK